MTFPPRFKFKLKWKIFLTFGPTLVLLIAIACYHTYSSLEERFDREVKDGLLKLASTIASSIDPERIRSVRSETDDYYAELKGKLRSCVAANDLLYISLYRRKGSYFTYIADADANGDDSCCGLPAFDFTPGLEDAWRGEPVANGGIYDPERWVTLNYPVKTATGEVVAVMDMSRDVFSLAQAHRDLVERLSGFVALVGLLGLLLSILFARSLVRNLDAIMAGLRRIGAGDYSFRFRSWPNDEIGDVARSVNEMAGHVEEKTRMSKFVSESVREAVKGDLEAAGGEERKVTILFSDIRSFTALTERHPPREVVAMLNSVLDAMSGIIQAHGGIIDKFIGDCIMAVFHPGASGDDERRAVSAGLAMMEELERINRARAAEGRFTVSAGVGINTGNVISGVIGSPKVRLDYTVIGDPVNLAARLEGMSKLGRHTRVILSGSTYAAVRADFECALLGAHEIKGKSGATELYEVVGRVKPGEAREEAAR